MLKLKNIFSLTIGLFSCVLFATIFITFGVKSQEGQGNSQTLKIMRKARSSAVPATITPTNKELDDAATPIVEFDNPDNPNDSLEQNLRNQKNSRYNNSFWVQSEPVPNIRESRRNDDWEIGLSDLPVEQSEYIIEGEVLESYAYLSTDKSGVYSEYNVKVKKILKSPVNSIPIIEKNILLERAGGRVRYSSSQIIRYYLSGQGSPKLGRKYLFFLAKAPQNSFKILTAYETQSHKILALDGANTTKSGRGQWVFDKHNGENFDDFFKKVKNKLNNHLQGGGN